MAQLPWVGDGITGPERQLLEEIAGLVVHQPDLAGRILEYPWIGSRSEVSPNAVKAVSAIRSAAATDLELARFLAGYNWLQDDVDTTEANALAGLSILARVDVGVAKSFAESTGFVGGTLEPATKASATIYSLFESDPALGRRVTGYPWVSDGLTSVETEALDAILELLHAAGAEQCSVGETLVGYSWLADGITDVERDGLLDLIGLLRNAGAAHCGSAGTMMGYEWLADDLTRNEADALYVFSRLLATAGAELSGLVATLVGYSWIADGINSKDRYDLRHFSDLLAAVGPEHAGVVETLMGYDWVADDLTENELTAFDAFSIFLDTAGAEHAGVVETLVGYDWVADDITESELVVLYVFNELLESAGTEHAGVVATLMGYDWVADDITQNETEAFLVFGAYGAEHASVVETLVGYDWVADGVTEYEVNGLSLLGLLLETSGVENSGVVEPWMSDRPIYSELSGKPWFDDGIDEEELPFFTVLHEAKSRSVHQYRDLLDSHHTRSKTISLPLAGDVKLLVFRHSPFPPGDDSIELMEVIMPVLEEFMEVPFPQNPVVLSIIEPSLRAGEDPQFGVGHSLSDHMAITGWEYNPNFDLAVFHEASHIYWGGHTGAPDWFTEGAAGFLPDYAREVLGVQTVEERRNETHGRPAAGLPAE